MISPFVSSHPAEARLLRFRRLLLELHPARSPFRIKPFGRIGRSLLYVPMAAVAVFSLIVCRSVASGRTTERSQVAQCSVALTALRPLAPVFARVDSEICSVVIHRVWCPYARAMALHAICGEQLGHMVRSARPGIVYRMTLVAILIR